MDSLSLAKDQGSTCRALGRSRYQSGESYRSANGEDLLDVQFCCLGGMINQWRRGVSLVLWVKRKDQL